MEKKGKKKHFFSERVGRDCEGGQESETARDEQGVCPGGTEIDVQYMV